MRPPTRDTGITPRLSSRQRLRPRFQLRHAQRPPILPECHHRAQLEHGLARDAVQAARDPA